MNNVTLVIIITLLFAFALTYSRMFYNLLKTKKELAKFMINVVVLEEYIKGIEDNKIQSDDSIHRENFIKFLSDSRDWAYTYIEEVQEGLMSFVDSVDQDIEHFNTYGEVLSTNRPDYDSMKRISEAYKKLKTLLPEEPHAKA